MAKEFSAAHYGDMPADQFQAEAKKLGVDLYGKSRDQQVNMVYNAELRRRQEETAAQQAVQAPAPQSGKGQPDYATMTVAELRDYADANDIDLGDATRKGDIIETIRQSDADNERDNGPEITAGREA